MGVSSFPQVTVIEREGISSCASGGSGCVLGKMPSQSSEAVAQAVQGGEKVTIPAGVQKQHVHDTGEHG